MKPSDLISFVCDTRLPLYFPFNYLEWITARDRISKTEDVKEIDFLFTMDLEHDYGSLGNGRNDFCSSFLNNIKPLLDKHGIKATIFVQGNLIKQYAEEIHALGDQHEVGLHGYAHEPWGEFWFVKQDMPNMAAREMLLKKSIQDFKEAGFGIPYSFRAPNMVIGDESLKLLAQNGFKIDSSYPSYIGGASKPYTKQEILEIPVTFDAKPHFGRFGVARYAVFNMSNIATDEFSGGFYCAVSRATRMQKKTSDIGLVVFVCHPWEFFSPYSDDKNLQYCNAENMKLLDEEITKLKQKYKVNFITMPEYRDLVIG